MTYYFYFRFIKSFCQKYVLDVLKDLWSVLDFYEYSDIVDLNPILFLWFKLLYNKIYIRKSGFLGVSFFMISSG